MEVNEIALDDTTTRIVDLLQQIKELNTMIALHRTVVSDHFMQKQYEYKKTEMVQELETLLQSFKIEIHLGNAA
jgi:DNA-binding HxlR family transcriptional regulator